MTDEANRSDGIRERGVRETRGAVPGRDGVKERDGVRENGMTPGTRAAGATGSSAGTGTGAPLVAGHDTTTGGDDTRLGRTMGVDDEPGHGRGEDRARGEGRGTGTAPGGSHSTGSTLLPHDENDKLATRLQHAVGGFVDEPRSAVEEADQVLEEVTARFTDAMTRRRRTLRTSWETSAGDRGSTDTEQLRLALRDYRELTERLLRL
ncbi:hypothetical protein [Streptomyces scabiei]|uniref:hypothetical protein n=1 Tax=Streptomyces scabiei TaxID=1930 RepID=UPI001B32B960|nr:MULTISPECIES: hypothetical protein [Streptomyces]MBP5894008.1 hypothetical protein [Streptomyces sp. LBUM 1481]MBP5924262.1 hypothetical protein [Streptomyces sp. LBUM 1483]MDX2690944.1 hypothetical protein [Streptomyces scabiei]MDX2756063.1 hypothetical protein [Streptomyces scabiei]MDX2809321.1 hypothetical protein [Streptomyces scabiei]